MSKLYNDFWDSFDDEKYQEVKDGRIEIRINKKTKEKFQKKIEENKIKGGIAKVLTSFIHFINNSK